MVLGGAVPLQLSLLLFVTPPVPEAWRSFVFPFQSIPPPSLVWILGVHWSIAHSNSLPAGNPS